MKTLKCVSFFIVLTYTSAVFAVSLPLIIDNRTEEYTFYFITNGQSIAIKPGEDFSVKLANHSTTQITFDYDGQHHTTTPWHTSGLGNGGVSFSQDPSSGQANFSWGFGPAQQQDPGTAPPYFSITGGLNTSGTDDWAYGISLQPHGNCVATTIRITQ